MSFYVDRIDLRIARNVIMKVMGHDFRKISSEAIQFDLNLESVCLSPHELHTTREREERGRERGKEDIDMNI